MHEEGRVRRGIWCKRPRQQHCAKWTAVQGQSVVGWLQGLACDQASVWRIPAWQVFKLATLNRSDLTELYCIDTAEDQFCCSSIFFFQVYQRFDSTEPKMKFWCPKKTVLFHLFCRLLMPLCLRSMSISPSAPLWSHCLSRWRTESGKN